MVQRGVDLAVGGVDRVGAPRRRVGVRLANQADQWPEETQPKLDQQDAKFQSDRRQAVASALTDPLNEAFGAELAEVVRGSKPPPQGRGGSSPPGRLADSRWGPRSERGERASRARSIHASAGLHSAASWSDLRTAHVSDKARLVAGIGQPLGANGSRSREAVTPARAMAF